MKISEVTSRTGVPASTLRYYESLGLLSPQRDNNGYRHFGDNDLERLEFITAAKQLDLELPEIHDLLSMADIGTCTEVRDTLQPLLTQQLNEVDKQIARLTQLRTHLDTARTQVSACPDSVKPCRSECAFLALNCLPVSQQ